MVGNMKLFYKDDILYMYVMVAKKEQTNLFNWNFCKFGRMSLHCYVVTPGNSRMPAQVPHWQRLSPSLLPTRLLYVTKLTASCINESIITSKSVTNSHEYCATKFSFNQCRWWLADMFSPGACLLLRPFSTTNPHKPVYLIRLSCCW